MPRHRSLAAIALALGCACSSSSTTPASDAGTDAPPDGAPVDSGAPRGTVDRSKLTSDECSDEIACPPNFRCGSYVRIDPELTGERCGPMDPCDIVTCPAGTQCFRADFTPTYVDCLP